VGVIVVFFKAERKGATASQYGGLIA
jgi:hypothetical protein